MFFRTVSSFILKAEISSDDPDISLLSTSSIQQPHQELDYNDRKKKKKNWERERENVEGTLL